MQKNCKVNTPLIVNILITGAAGYIGLHLAFILKKQGHSLWGIDLNLAENTSVFEKFFVGDSGNINFVKSILNEARIECVIHSIRTSSQDPLLSYNNGITGTTFLLKCLLERNIKNFIYLSSDQVYGNATQFPITEETPCSPINLEGYTHLAVENLLKSTSQVHRMKVVICRLFSVIGSFLSYPQQQNNLLSQIIRTQSINIDASQYPTLDGSQERDFIAIQDTVNAINQCVFSLFRLPNFSVFNISRGHSSSIKDLVLQVENILQKPISVTQKPNPCHEIAKLVADPLFSQSTLDWHLQYPTLQSIIEAEVQQNYG